MNSAKLDRLQSIVTSITTENDHSLNTELLQLLPALINLAQAASKLQFAPSFSGMRLYKNRDQLPTVFECSNAEGEVQEFIQAVNQFVDEETNKG